MRVGTTVSSSIKDACGGLRIGQHKVRCPECQGQRKNNRSDKPLSVSVDSLGVRYHCHHCGVSGGWVYKTSAKFDRPRPNEPKAKPITLNNMAKTNGRALEFMHERQIPQELIDSHVILDTYSFGGERMDAIGFPYRKDGEVVAIKWRSAEGKRFSQQNKCSDFYNIENYQHGNDLLICEGELDALSWMASGLPDNISVVSIPNGAPPKVRDGKIDPADDNKFRYVWNAKSKIESAPRIIFNTDNDGPGEALCAGSVDLRRGPSALTGTRMRARPCERRGRGSCSLSWPDPYRSRLLVFTRLTYSTSSSLTSTRRVRRRVPVPALSPLISLSRYPRECSPL